MYFFTFSNVDIQFARKKLLWRSYTSIKALLTIKQVEIVIKKGFSKVGLIDYIETFIIHVTFLPIIVIHLAKNI